MTDDTETPRIGDESYDHEAGTVNIGVTGTVGPDYLGQESVDVDGHRWDRPGVTADLSDTDPMDPRRRQQATATELPVLLSSDIDYDPIEGATGSFTLLVEGECDRCGYDRIQERHTVLPHRIRQTCNACGAQRGGQNSQFTMPTTEQERADERADRDELVAEVNDIELYNNEATSAEHLTLVQNRRADSRRPSIGSVRASSMRKLARQLATYEAFDTALLFEQLWTGVDDYEGLLDELSPLDRTGLALNAVPYGFRIAVDERNLLDGLTDEGVRRLLTIFDDT